MFELYPSASVKKTWEHKILETRSVSVFKLRGDTYTVEIRRMILVISFYGTQQNLHYSVATDLFSEICSVVLECWMIDGSPKIQWLLVLYTSIKPI